MKRLFCDRCGKEIIGEPTGNEEIRYVLQEKERKDYSYNIYSCGFKEIELCQECMNELYNWIHSNGSN